MDVQPFRVFSGYSGWGAGQLETEMDLGGWLTTDATAEIVFEEDVADLWQAVIHLTGEEFLKGTLGITDFPSEPGLN
jgi:putative transcriptional regulator